MYFLCSSSSYCSSSPAVAREVRDEGRGGSFFRGVRGDEDESSRQVPEAGGRPPRTLLQPSFKHFPHGQGEAGAESESSSLYYFFLETRKLLISHDNRHADTFRSVGAVPATCKSFNAAPES